MIVIYEQHDLSQLTTRQPENAPPSLNDVRPDLRLSDAIAETVYMARPDGRFQMVKARNAPLDPYPVKIKVERDVNV